MTHKQNLEALMENVIIGVSMHDEYKSVFPDIKLHTAACLAYNGSLDAAQELHKAVLGDRWKTSNVQEHHDTWLWSIECVSGENEGVELWREADNPARAWLIAILKALISECEE